MIPRTVHTYSARRSGEMWQGECRTYRAGRLLSATDAGKPEWRRCDAVGTARIRANALALASGGTVTAEAMVGLRRA